jgi:hypothetical protein
MQLSPSTLTLTAAGANQATVISIVPTNGFAGNVTISMPLPPVGIDATPPFPLTLSAGTSQAATFTADGSTATGNTTFVLTGTSGSFTATAALKLSVQPPSTARPGSIASSYFGLHTNRGVNFPLAVPYGNFRFWDAGPTVQWQGLHVCNSTTANCQSNPEAYTSLSSSTLDEMLANLRSAGINDVLYTGGRVPSWGQGATSYTPACNYGGGSCVLPLEMNVDGTCSGANSTCSIWDTFWHLLATHVNDPTFLQTHTHIKYWEPWNEWFEDPIIGSGSSTEVNASWAEMLRMTEDMRCVIKGVGTIHNYPTAGSSTSCSSYLSLFGWSTVDAAAVIVTPDSNDRCCQNVMKNFLYCNSNPYKDLNAGTATSCTWSGGLNWGSQAVDAIDLHFYFAADQPEQEAANVVTIEGWLDADDRTKPLINGEGSSGVMNAGRNIWNDLYSVAGSVPRSLALYWSSGVVLNFWYAYSSSGALWNSGLTPAGIAWTISYDWLNGAAPTNTSFCSSTGTLYVCPFTEANGRLAELVWDSQYGPGGTTPPSNCSTASNPTICGSTAYTVPAPYNGDWVDIQGTVHQYSPTVTVGAVPILLESP